MPILPTLLWTLWNLILAALPVAFAHALVAAERSRRGRSGMALVVVLAGAWLAFLPNAPYLLTEWRHFLYGPHFRAVRDATNPNDLSVLRVVKHAAFFAAYSGFGVACFALAIRPVADLVRSRGGRPGMLAAPFFFVVAVGVYLGLILRLNSWDLVLRPRYVMILAARAVFTPALLPVIAAFAALLCGLFLASDIWMDGLAVRRQGLRVVPRRN